MNCTPKVLCLIFGIQCKRPNDFEVSLLRISIHFIEIKVVNMRNRFLCIRYIKKILYFFLFLFSAVFGWETATLSAQQTEETVLQGIVKWELYFLPLLVTKKRKYHLVLITDILM